MFVKNKLFVISIIQLLAIAGTVDCRNLSKPENDETGFSVLWEKTISAQSLQKEKNNLLNKIKGFLFGKNSLNLIKPVNITALDSDNLIILDQGLTYPVSLKISDNEIKEIVNNKTFPSLLGLCNWKESKILFSDSKLNKIFIFDQVKDEVIPFTDEELVQPTGIAYNFQKKEIWISETGKHRLLVMNDSGKINKIIGKRGKDTSEFNFPTYLWIDNKGYSYVVDAMNFRIQIFDQNGVFLNMFGETGDAPGYFSSIKGLATDSYGHIYIVDALFNVVQVFDRNGTFLYKFGGPGTYNGQFYKPTGIFIDSNDLIYVTDTYNSRVQIFKLIKGKK